MENEKTKARILVVDDHPIVLDGLAGLIDRQPDLACCATAATIPEARQILEASPVDLMLLDLRVGTTDGLENIKAFAASFPNVPILVLSQFDEATYAERALRAGARGYIMKEQATEELLGAIRQVLSGQLYFSPSFARRAVEHLLGAQTPVREAGVGSLSDRELHVFRAIGANKTTRQIAAELNLSVKTIETYREHIKYKLGLATAAELAERARAAIEGEG